MLFRHKGGQLSDDFVVSLGQAGDGWSSETIGDWGTESWESVEGGQSESFI